MSTSYAFNRRVGRYATITAHNDCPQCDDMLDSSIAYNGPCITNGGTHVGIAVQVRCDHVDCLCPICSVNINWLLNNAAHNVRVLIETGHLDESSLQALHSNDGLIVDLAAGNLSAALWLRVDEFSGRRVIYGFCADIEIEQPINETHRV